MEKIRAPEYISTLEKEDGGKTETWRESINLLLEKLLPRDSEENEQQGHIDKRQLFKAQYLSERICYPYDIMEVRGAIREGKKNKSPGPDGITN